MLFKRDKERGKGYLLNSEYKRIGKYFIFVPVVSGYSHTYINIIINFLKIKFYEDY